MEPANFSKSMFAITHMVGFSLKIETYAAVADVKLLTSEQFVSIYQLLYSINISISLYKLKKSHMYNNICKMNFINICSRLF